MGMPHPGLEKRHIDNVKNPAATISRSVPDFVHRTGHRADVGMDLVERWLEFLDLGRNQRTISCFHIGLDGPQRRSWISNILLYIKRGCSWWQRIPKLPQFCCKICLSRFRVL